MSKVLNIVFPDTPEWLTNKERPPATPVPAADHAIDDLDGSYPDEWDPGQFARRQLSGLVQRVFFPGWPHPSRQVVVSTVDQFQTAEVCARIAHVMAEEIPGTVCAVEAATESPDLEGCLVSRASAPTQQDPPGLHPNCTLVRPNLWLLTLRAFLLEGFDQAKVTWLRSRLSGLRREFDYTIIHAPALSLSSDTILLGQLSDGVILVLQAHSTRRAAARSACDALRQAKVHLLGSVLDQRTFPVPQTIYRKL